MQKGNTNSQSVFILPAKAKKNISDAKCPAQASKFSLRPRFSIQKLRTILFQSSRVYQPRTKISLSANLPSPPPTHNKVHVYIISMQPEFWLYEEISLVLDKFSKAQDKSSIRVHQGTQQDLASEDHTVIHATFSVSTSQDHDGLLTLAYDSRHPNVLKEALIRWGREVLAVKVEAVPKN